MSEWSDWLLSHPAIKVPGEGLQAQVEGQTGAGTGAPSGPQEIAAGGANTWVVAAVVILVVALLIVAWRTFRSAPAAPGEPEPLPTPSKDPGAAPTRIAQAERQVVDKPSEILDEDSLADIKRKKMEKVDMSYAEVRDHLHSRKAGQVKKAQQDRRASASSDESLDAEASVDEAGEQGDDAPEAAVAEVEAAVAEAVVAEAAVAEAAVAEAAEASEGEAQEEGAPSSEDAAEVAQGDAGAEEAAAAVSALEPPSIETENAFDMIGDDVNSGWGEISFDALDLGSTGELSLSLSPDASGLSAADKDEEAADEASEPSSAAAKATAPEPAKAEPAKAEPAKVEPAKVEPAKAEPAKVEAPSPEPAKAKAEPARVEPARAEPAKASTARAEAPRDEPVRSLKDGLEKTRGGFIARLNSIFKRQADIDEQLIEDLEEVLYTADIGPQSVQALLKEVRTSLGDEAQSSKVVWGFVRKRTEALLTANTSPMVIGRRGDDPLVVLVVGVNGVGKTTTLGKLAMRYTDDGHKVLMVAGDTFRAAATEQLEEWGERTGLAVHAGQDGADPASVVFEGIERAKREGFDVVLCDTAGRLTNKKNLMKELEKIGRVSGKALDGAPHETLLVLDANTGLQALQQARMFQEVVDITGIALTKLDGTAKGGMIIAICQELEVPVRYIGIGEGVYDLRPFDAAEFVDALFM